MTKYPPGLSADDWQASGTVYDLSPLRRALRPVEEDGRRLSSVLELGCGIGSVAAYVGDRLDIPNRFGVDLDQERLEKAAERGLKTITADLETDRLPIADHSIDLVLSFGAFEHLAWFDNALSETRRVLRPDGWFLLGIPNLGSYVNRMALLLGYQPRDIEVSQHVVAGVLPIYHTYFKSMVLGHVHSATLRCTREVLEVHGFRIEARNSMAPYATGITRFLDAVVRPIPSLSRRFILTARPDPSTAGPGSEP